MDYEKFFEISHDVTIWKILDSQFLTTFLAAIFGVFLLRYESRLKRAEESAQDATDIVKYQAEAQDKEQEIEEAAPEIPVPANALDFRDQTEGVIEQAKQYLEHKVALDEDRRRQRTYERIPRYDYNVLAIALHERDRISDVELSDVMRIFSEWRKYSKGRAANKLVPAGVYESIRDAYARLAPVG